VGLRLSLITMSGTPRVRCAAAVKPEPAKAAHLTGQAEDREMGSRGLRRAGILIGNPIIAAVISDPRAVDAMRLGGTYR
jgi:hypothetical protein